MLQAWTGAVRVDTGIVSQEHRSSRPQALEGGHNTDPYKTKQRGSRLTIQLYYDNGWRGGSDVATRGGGGASQRHSLSTCQPDGARCGRSMTRIVREGAATAGRDLHVRVHNVG